MQCMHTLTCIVYVLNLCIVVYDKITILECPSILSCRILHVDKTGIFSLVACKVKTVVLLPKPS